MIGICLLYVAVKILPSQEGDEIAELLIPWFEKEEARITAEKIRY
jgi:hypothetical protein